MPEQILVSVIMGSKSDWDVMRNARDMLNKFDIPCECRVISAHRALPQLSAYIVEAEQRGVEVFIGGAGMAAHLPGVIAAHTTRPVLGVPLFSPSFGGMDALMSIVQMPQGIPVGTLAVGRSGAVNAALLAISILANSRPELRDRLKDYRAEMAEKVLNETLD